MSEALPGEHYCAAHQGNHSHYAQHNCTVCKQAARIAELEAERDMWKATDVRDATRVDELAAQVEALRNAVGRVVNCQCRDITEAYSVLSSALALPNLAADILAKRDAEILRKAADVFDEQGEFKGHGIQLREMADDIEKGVK